MPQISNIFLLLKSTELRSSSVSVEHRAQYTGTGKSRVCKPLLGRLLSSGCAAHRGIRHTCRANINVWLRTTQGHGVLYEGGRNRSHVTYVAATRYIDVHFALRKRETIN
ncbi:unnamed protein product, partial [Ceratitis capitata]